MLKTKEKGITLIALVITIVILLILAGITITTLTGNNGILTQANNAKKATGYKSEEEKIKVAIAGSKAINYQGEYSCNALQKEFDYQFGKGKTHIRKNMDGSVEVQLEEKEKTYIVFNTGEISLKVDWKEAKEKAIIPEEQNNKSIVGIGTDGKVVNMDYWKYSYDTVTNGYGLNSANVFQNTEYNKNGSNTETIRKAGYMGNGTNANDIIIPQYISVDGGKNYSPVTSLYRTFLENNNIIETPNIPMTVSNIFCAFESCKNLKKFEIPSSVTNINWAFSATAITEVREINNNITNMAGSFSSCEKLEKVKGIIPSSVEQLNRTFSEDTNLKEANIELQEGVKNIRMMFYRCENLEQGPSVIPSTVDDMTQTFQKCLKLRGPIQIKAAPTKYGNAFGQDCATKSGEILIVKDGTNNREIVEKIIENGDWTKKYIKGEWEM